MRFSLIILLFCLLPRMSFYAQSKTIIAHSHNDYEQDAPLTKAISLGFQSIEIDILLHKNELIVTHNSFNLDNKPNIEDLYFKPLSLLSSDTISTTWLLVDIKKYNIETLEALHVLVDKYNDLFLTREDIKQNRPYQILLSGDLPRKEIISNPKWKYFFVDGRISDLDKNLDSKTMPLISSNITAFTSWQRNHCLKDSEIIEVKTLVNRIHNQGKKLRFWNTEDNPIIWNQLMKLGVDVISVDDLESFKNYLASK